jgi:hypothetical protein
MPRRLIGFWAEIDNVGIISGVGSVYSIDRYIVCSESIVLFIMLFVKYSYPEVHFLDSFPDQQLCIVTGKWILPIK